MIIESRIQRKKSMVNNFSVLREVLKFPDSNSFYFLQIFKRRKDNLDLQRDMVVIAEYQIWSLEQFDSLEDEIRDICDRENARAYLRLNRRDSKKIAFQVLKRTSDLIVSENYSAVKKVYSSCCGEFSSDSDKKWIVDIDWKDWVNKAEVGAILVPLLEELQEEAGNTPLTKILTTRNGIHIISRPFNLQKFHQSYPKVDVHKDNPTILYCP